MSLSSHLDRNLILLFVYSLFDLISEYVSYRIHVQIREYLHLFYPDWRAILYKQTDRRTWHTDRRTDAHTDWQKNRCAIKLKPNMEVFLEIQEDKQEIILRNNIKWAGWTWPFFEKSISISLIRRALCKNTENYSFFKAKVYRFFFTKW